MQWAPFVLAENAQNEEKMPEKTREIRPKGGKNRLRREKICPRKRKKSCSDRCADTKLELCSMFIRASHILIWSFSSMSQF